MATHVLASKISAPPPRAVRVDRARLFRLLERRMRPGCKLVLVAAAAGSGKTTLVAEWAARQRLPVAWLSVDAGDNDLHRFWSGILAALAHAAPPPYVSHLPTAQTAESLPAESLPDLLLNSLRDLPGDMWIVLDDFHAITAAPIHDSFVHFLEHLPPRLCVVMTSRIDPPLPLSRMRARGELGEVRAADLRFSLDEAQHFFSDVMGLHLQADDVERLEARTEGWIAGLQLAALSLQGMERLDDVRRFVAAFTGSHRHIVDYLLEEVLRKQDDDVQSFLLQTSILERLCGPLCEAVTGQPDGQTMLERLDRANLFLIALDGERTWFRYHHLFADLLRARAARGQPTPVAELHRRAAAWYEANALIDDALHHALAAGEHDRAARMVMQHGAGLLQRGEIVTLQAWLDALPRDVVLAHPRLCIDRARVDYLNHRLSEMDIFLDAAARHLDAGHAASDDAPVLRVELIILRGYLASEREAFDEAIALLNQALDALPETRPVERGLVLMYIGHANLMSGRVQAAVDFSEQAIVHFRAAQHTFGTMTATGQMVLGLWQMGKLRTVRKALEDGLQWANSTRAENLPPVAMMHYWRAHLAWEQNDLETADRTIRLGLDLAQMGRPLPRVRAHVFLAQLRQSQGDSDGAEAAMQTAETIVRHWDTAWAWWFVATNRVGLWLRQGHFERALHWAQHDSNGPLRPDECLTHYREAELIMLARVLVAQSTPDSLDQARDVLDSIQSFAESAGRWGVVAEMLVIKALALFLQGRIQPALDAIVHALALTEPEGHARLFIDEGAPMAALLSHLPPSHPQRDHAERLLAALRAETPAPAATSRRRDHTHEHHIEPLSEREIEVLRLLADGLTSNDIAERLVIAVETARKHIKNVYGKLDAHGRVEAIRRAQDLGLL